MISILLLHVWAAAALEPIPWSELVLSIGRDPGMSSDTATICRVRVENLGRGTWPGHRIAFEARVFANGRMIDRRRGRFGSTLGPHEALETVVIFAGIYDHFEVTPVEKGQDRDAGRPRRGRTGGRRGRKR